MDVLHLLYHELRAVPADYSYVVSSERFEQSCKLFVQLSSAESHGLRPELTFDDGHISNYELALPILEQHELKATFFITAAWTGRRAGYMDWKELRALDADGQRIGAHGMTHKLLTHCSSKELDQELRQARLRLEDGVGRSVTTMSLPGGRSNAAVLNSCWESGYEEVFTSAPRAESASRPPHSTVGRLNVLNSMSTSWLQQVLSPETGLLRRLERKHRLKCAAQTILGDRLYAKLWSALNREELPSDDPAEADLPEIAGR
jgi:peptidoglycan/xylan/chitin deacetylase (PgdA/CDA1 family)